MTEERVVLEHDADLARLDCQRSAVAAAEEHAALIRELEAGQDAQEGGLAGPRGTKQADKFAFPNLQADGIDDKRRAETLRYLFYLDPQSGCP